MDNTSRPRRLVKPFADAATGLYRRIVPAASQIGVQDGAASLTDGFPPLNFDPVSAGGVPPFGQDMNGILYDVSAAARWQAAGGSATYDATFAAAIGGYPYGAVLISTVTPGVQWVALVDNLMNDPDVDPTNWRGQENEITSSNLSAAGYRVHRDGFKECWGTSFCGQNSTTTIPLPIAHSAWVIPVGSCVRSSADEMNIGVQSAGLSSFNVRNNNVESVTFFWHTRGV